MYVQHALFVSVLAYLCVIGLYEMEKAGTGLYRVGGCCVEMRRGFPRTMFTFYCSGVARQGIGGRLVDESRGNVYITLLGSKNISGWLP